MKLKPCRKVGEQYAVDKSGWLYKYSKSKERYIPMTTRTSRFMNGNCVFVVGTEKRKYTVEQLKEEFNRL